MRKTRFRMRGCGGALGVGRDEIIDLRAWLTAVVSRIGLDRLRSAAHRREAYYGEWLPEPVVTAVDRSNPLAAVVADEDAFFGGRGAILVR